MARSAACRSSRRLATECLGPRWGAGPVVSATNLSAALRSICPAKPSYPTPHETEAPAVQIGTMVFGHPTESGPPFARRLRLGGARRRSCSGARLLLRSQFKRPRFGLRRWGAHKAVQVAELVAIGSIAVDRRRFEHTHNVAQRRIVHQPPERIAAQFARENARVAIDSRVQRLHRIIEVHGP
jgi:hypothetical protein